MRARSVLCVLAVAAVAVLALTGTALASTITYDNFATDTAGSVNASKWTVTLGGASGTSGTAVIGNNDSLGQSLELFQGWNSDYYPLPGAAVTSTSTWGINTDFSIGVIGSGFRNCAHIGVVNAAGNSILLEDDLATDGHWALTVNNGVTNWASGDLGLPDDGLAGVSKIDIAWTASSVKLFINGNTTPTVNYTGSAIPLASAQLSVQLFDYVQPGFCGQYSTWGDYTSVATTTLAPEPSTLVLLAVGLISLLAYAWRRRK